MWPLRREEKSIPEKPLPDPGQDGLQALLDFYAGDSGIGDSYSSQLSKGYEQNAYVARCVDLRAQAVASLKPLVTDADGNELDGHPLEAIVLHPNGRQSWRELVVELQTHYAISGNGYLLVLKTIDGPRLYAVRPDRIAPVRSDDLFNPIKSWIIDGRLTVPAADVVHIHGALDQDGMLGISPLRSASEAILQQTMSKRWNRSLMEKGAKPSLAIVFKQKLTPKAFAEFVQRYRIQHQGTENAGTTLVLDDDASVVSAGFNARDMDYANGVTVSAREIAIALQVPPELIGDSANKTYSNAQEANREFAAHTVLPLASQMYEAISRKLWPAGDAVLTFDRSQVDELKGDESALISALTACDFLTTNEKRARLSYADIEGGDQVLTGMGKVPLSEVSTPIEELMGGE